MKDTYKNSLEFYINIISSQDRIEQSTILLDIMESNFRFDKVICVETGCSRLTYGAFGLLLAKISNDSGGEFHSVDINESSLRESEDLIKQHLPGIHQTTSLGDSVEWLRKTNIVPNLVHLDSWDLDISNPLPSCLHGWNEFVAIKDKMPSGSIILIDDNYMQGSVVNWMLFYTDTGEVFSNKNYHIDYPIVGKGAHIYQWCQDPSTEWDIVGDHYLLGSNIKVIIQKR